MQLNLTGSKFVLIGTYYKPHELDQFSFEEFNKSLNLVKQSNSTIWLLRDFNLQKTDWEHQMPKPDCSHPSFYSECLEAFSDCLLEQIMTSPTQGQNILNLFFTTKPTLIDKVSILPGLSDHNIILAKVSAKPELTQQVPREISLYKKADWDQLKQSMRDLHLELQFDPATTDIHELWDKFAGRLQQGTDSFIPTRKTGTRDGLPWINYEIYYLIRKRDKHYKHWARSGRPVDQTKFLQLQHLEWRLFDRAHEVGGWVERWHWVASSAGASYYFGI